MTQKPTLLLVVMCLALTGCKACASDWRPADPEKWERAFNSCLDKTAKARSGASYTTNDDEDWDDVVLQCRHSASAFSGSVLIKHCTGE